MFTTEMLDAMDRLPGDIGSLPMPSDDHKTPTSPQISELGKVLFFDPRLSADNNVSCATCHDSALAFGDGRPRAQGIDGEALSRNTPTLPNVGLQSPYFWDGRVTTLEEQAIMPILNLHEMGVSGLDAFAAKLNALSEYPPLFDKAFGRAPNPEDAAAAIAAFERTLITPNARFDLYARGRKDALTDEEKRGLILFVGKAACTQCHLGASFSDGKFYDLGVPPGEANDVGRFAVTQDEADRNAFKSPTLRNVVLTGPYMHDGSIASIEDVVAFYNRGGGTSESKTDRLFELGLSEDEQRDLVAFLGTLTGDIPETEVPEPFKNYPAYAKRAPPQAPELNYVPSVPEKLESLQDLMARGIHEQFTFLGFTIWHSRPFTEKRRSHAQSASKYLNTFATQLQELRPEDFNESDASLYSAVAEKIATVTRSLNKAAECGTLSEIRQMYTQTEMQCLKCHERFRPDLVWVETPTTTDTEDPQLGTQTGK